MVVNERTLTQLPLQVRRCVSDQEIRDLPRLDLDTYFDPILSGMVLDLKAALWAEQLVDDTYHVTRPVYVPATWFQHLRKRLGLSYRTERIDVLVAVQFTRYATYPTAQIPDPMFGNDVVIREFASET